MENTERQPGYDEELSDGRRVVYNQWWGRKCMAWDTETGQRAYGEVDDEGHVHLEPWAPEMTPNQELAISFFRLTDRFPFEFTKLGEYSGQREVRALAKFLTEHPTSLANYKSGKRRATILRVSGWVDKWNGSRKRLPVLSLNRQAMRVRLVTE